MASSEPLFGTDGIRGPFGRPPLDSSTVTRLGICLAEHLRSELGRAPRLVVGGDTRASTPELASWLLGGLSQGGAEGADVGVLPTPGIAFLARQAAFDGGVAISASHNPAPDNGIKLFDAEGYKWDRAAEQRLETALAATPSPQPQREAAPQTAREALAETYFTHLLSSLPGEAPLAGLRLTLDAANGAAAPFAERLFSRAGAEVAAVGVSPDGTNINLDRGSTRPEHLIDRVRETGSQLGVAFDGDADRALLVDETGCLQDGDTMMYLWACALAERGELAPAAIVATTMSNLGLELALRELGIDTVRCDVGDRVVVETMRAHGIVLGGEQSGHLIHLALGSTGDGLMTALQLARLVVMSGRPLSELSSPIERLPQVLINVPVARKVDFAELPVIADRAREIEAQLGDTGRLLLRYSGTEPLARVMIEGRSQSEIDMLAAQLADVIGDTLGAPQ